MKNAGTRIPAIDPKAKGKYYKKTRAINAVGREGMTKTVAIPTEVINRKAEEKNMTPDEFVKTHQAILTYNSFDGVFISFELKPNKNPEREMLPKSPKD